MRRLTVIGVGIVDQSMDEAVADVTALVRASGPRSLFFVNAHTLNCAAADPSYRDVLNRGTRVFGDGAGVRLAARWRGLRLRANLNGTDLVPRLFGTDPGLRCFLVGSTPERTEAILATARRLFPRVDFVGAHHGYLDDESSRALCERIVGSGANIVLVGMGNPIQERWIDRHRDRVPGALLVGVGGLLEYWSGALVRAPALARRFSLEWAWIMMRQPWKARRYLLGNPLFVARALRTRAADLRHPANTDDSR